MTGAEFMSLGFEGIQAGLLALLAFRLGRVLSTQEYHDRRLLNLEGGK